MVVENLPWQKCFEVYDRPHTFFYLDPPYPSTQPGMYAFRFAWEDHEALPARVLKLKGKWLLSYQDHPRLVKLYRRRGVTIERLKKTYNLGSGTAKSRRGCYTQELLIRNY